MAAIKSQIHFIGHDFGMPQISLLQYSPNFMSDDMNAINPKTHVT